MKQISKMSRMKEYIARLNDLSVTRCSEPFEWEAVKYFRNKYFFEPIGISDPYTWTFDSLKHAHLLLYHNEEIIGYASIQFWPEHRAALRMIVIDEDKRNSSFGSQFLKLCEEWLKGLNVKSLHVESRPTSLNFYLKNGYVLMPFDDPDGHESDPNDIAVGKRL